MGNFKLVDGIDSLQDMQEDVPNLFFAERSTLFLVPKYLFEQVSSVCELHDNAC